jgi:hypothetical protein
MSPLWATAGRLARLAEQMIEDAGAERDPVLRTRLITCVLHTLNHDVLGADAAPDPG